MPVSPHAQHRVVAAVVMHLVWFTRLAASFGVWNTVKAFPTTREFSSGCTLGIACLLPSDNVHGGYDSTPSLEMVTRLYQGFLCNCRPLGHAGIFWRRSVKRMRPTRLRPSPSQERLQQPTGVLITHSYD